MTDRESPLTNDQLVDRLFRALDATGRPDAATSPDDPNSWPRILMDASDRFDQEERYNVLIGFVGVMFGVLNYTIRTLVDAVEHVARLEDGEPVPYAEMVNILRMAVDLEIIENNVMKDVNP